MNAPRRWAALTALALALFGLTAAQSSVARSTDKPIARDTPAVVAQGQARNHGRHNGNELFTLNVGLAVRDSAGLDALIRAASTPGSAQYGHYLTNAQYLATYAPTKADVQSATAWLKSQGLDVTGVSPDNLLIHVQAKVNTIEQAFGVAINDYTANGRSFHSNDRDPIVPAGLAISWISGMSNYDVFKPNVTCVTPPSTNCSLDGTDLKNVYDVVGDGAGQTLGFTLWGESLPQSDFTSYATATGTTALTIGQAGDDGLDFVTVDGSTTESDTDAEVALDTQNAHTVAPKIHETYWLGHDNSFSTLEDVLNDAANNTLGINVISNSWGAQSNPCSVDSNMESSLQHGAAVGITFYFSSGDAGASGGCSYPAVSQYVVAVGGTALNTNPPGTYVSESAVDNGGGCLGSEPRPSWQTGIGTAQTWGSPPTTCTGRAEPDVSAITGFCTDGTNCGPGTFIFFGGTGHCCFGGTSLAAPVWAASTVVWNNHNAHNGRPGVGFDAPLIYALANDPTTYARDFHDVTTGTNGFAATTGWDEATGWGSPDVNKLANNPIDITYTGPTTVEKGQTITLSATLLDQGASTTLATAALGTLKVSLAAAGSFCDANVDSSGHAQCDVTINDDPGGYRAIAAYAGDAAYVGGSQTVNFTVLHIPTKITYSGDTSGDYNDPVTMTATLVDDGSPTSFTKGDKLSGEKLTFSLGAESCSDTTNSSGVASCQVTPLDNPGPYSVVVSFAGDEPTYEASMSSTGFTLKQEESKLVYNGPVTSHYHDSVLASATLTDPDGGAPIAGKTVTFTLGVGDTCSTATDSSGVASCTIKPTQTGTKTMSASFAGDVDYVSSGDSKSFSITPEETTMTYTGPTVILAGAGGLTLTATLVEEGANDADGDAGAVAPNPQETVTLSVGTQSCTGTTSSSDGTVSCLIPSVTVPLGPEVVKASFGGDAFYQAASAQKDAIVFAFPSRGAFTLGNTTAATAGTSTVTWWGDTWPSLNVLSGGVAPSSDKGFAGTITLPTTTPPTSCGSAWTTTGGNSPPPTSGVPSYMGVVVTSSVGKSGNNISGNSVHIVVVKINPGYTPTPSTHGTGTIVATFC